MRKICAKQINKFIGTLSVRVFFVVLITIVAVLKSLLRMFGSKVLQFLHVIQKYTKFAGLYFLHFTTFRVQFY